MTEQLRQQAIDHANANRDEFLERYFELLRFPSIGADPAYKADVQACADWIVAEMARIGFDNCQAMPTAGNPAVYGEWLKAGDDKPTVLVYAHYDVQPVDPLDEWVSPPFAPEIRDGKLYARGAIDDKSGVWVNLKAFESMLEANGTLPVNVKILFEGEEESGSPTMQPFVNANKDLLKADFMLVSDGGSEPDEPTIMYGARGICAAQVKVTGPAIDLHSGGYGGVVNNPLHVAGRIIGSFHDDEGRVTLPGYYDDVRKLDEAELVELAKQEPEELAAAREETGVKNFWGETVASYMERSKALPTLDVNGMWGGYLGNGTKTVLPAEAGFKVSLRLVADQDPDAVMQSLVDHINSFASDTIDIEIKQGPKSRAVTLMFDSPEVEAIQRAYVTTWGKRAMMVRTGGSVPIMSMFQQELAMPLTELGFGIGKGLHSPNEYYILDYYYRSIEMAIHFYYNLID
ncbi:dipeptidase [Chloroflexota bacterium]